MPKQLSKWMNSIAKSVEDHFHQTCWRPPADVYTNKDGVLIKLDLPGMSFEEIDISISEDQVTVSGCRHDHLVESGLTHQQLEICYSSFTRVIDLVEPVEPESASYEMEHGMLIVRLQKISRSDGGKHD